jgi:hypothetical protein
MTLLKPAATLALLLLATAVHANSARLEQVGNDNQGTIDQTGAGSYARLYQQGERLNGLIVQDVTGHSAFVEQLAVIDSIVSIEQQGGFNTASVYQRDTEGASAGIFQDGSENSVTLTQASSDYPGAGGQEATITQVGSQNDYRIEQNGPGNVVTAASYGDLNTVQVQQDGLSNQAVITQTGFGNAVSVSQDFSGIAALVQTGDNNRIDLSQGGRDPSGATLTQTGNDNVANAATWGRFNRLDFEQAGNANLLNGTVDGRDSMLSGFSRGDDNIVTARLDGAVSEGRVEQTGSGNSADLNLEGYEISAQITQTGDANSAVIAVQGSYEFGAATSASIVQAGNGNVASITQR